MVEKAFVVSDAHGKLRKFEELIINWNRKDKSIILGDMIDRGEDSIGVLERVNNLKLVKKYNQCDYSSGSYGALHVKYSPF